MNKKISRYLFIGELMIPFSRIKKLKYDTLAIMNGDLQVGYISMNKLKEDLKLLSINTIGNEKIINYKIQDADYWRF